MKKIIFLFALLMAFQASFAKKLNLKLNLKEGETYQQVMVSKTKVAQEIMGQKIDIQMTMTSTTSFKVVEITDGNYNMEVSYDEMSMNMEMPQGSQNYSSESTVQDDPISSVLSSLIDRKFSITMNKKGEVLEVEGMDEMMASMFDKIGKGNPQIQQMQEQFKNAFGEDAFKGNFEKTTAIYPEGKIKKGAEWEKESSQSIGFTINSKSKYKLVDFNRAVASVTGSSILETPEDSQILEMGPMKMQYDLKGEMKTEMKIDIKTGWIQEAQMSQKLDGEITMTGENIPEPMKLPMKMKSDITITN